MAIHNFINENSISYQKFRPYKEYEDYINVGEDTNMHIDPVANNSKSMTTKRMMELSIVSDKIRPQSCLVGVVAPFN